MTGGSRGLGEAIVRRLAEAGAAVVLTGRGREALQNVEAQVAATGAQVLGVQADLCSLKDSQNIIDQAIERFGRIDILVNNAAVFPACTTMEMTEEVWDKTVDPDLKGTYFLSQFAARKMIDAGRGGRIINILSNDAFRPTGFLSAYGAAKLGMWSVTQSMAKELAPHRIQVNAITPGSITTKERIAALSKGNFDLYQVPENAAKTRAMFESVLNSDKIVEMMTTMMPFGRPGFPDEIAKAVLFLASDMASYISGANITVDGAQSLR
ncbi:MAG: SDR family oxidoreductase [Desulfatitalea sp.]|nr:SDR family oxidoreductase [Desulfatitalea sp.]